MITKLDLMDEGTDARDVLENKLLPLRRGVCLFYCDVASFYLALAISLLLQFLRSENFNLCSCSQNQMSVQVLPAFTSILSLFYSCSCY